MFTESRAGSDDPHPPSVVAVFTSVGVHQAGGKDAAILSGPGTPIMLNEARPWLPAPA
jgi:hypothetical protein